MNTVELHANRIADLKDVHGALANLIEVADAAEFPMPTAAWGAVKAVHSAAVSARITVDFEIRRLEEEVPRDAS